MRPLPKVIDAMLSVIPEDHPIRPILEDNKSSVEFAAPEMMNFWWGEVYKTLKLLVPFTDKWAMEAGEIFGDTRDYRAYIKSEEES